MKVETPGDLLAMAALIRNRTRQLYRDIDILRKLTAQYEDALAVYLDASAASPARLDTPEETR